MESVFLPNKATKNDIHLAFAGSIRYKVGLNAKLSLQGKSFSSSFDLFTDAEDEVVVKNLQ